MSNDQASQPKPNDAWEFLHASYRAVNGKPGKSILWVEVQRALGWPIHRATTAITLLSKQGHLQQHPLTPTHIALTWEGIEKIEGIEPNEQRNSDVYALLTTIFDLADGSPGEVAKHTDICGRLGWDSATYMLLYNYCRYREWIESRGAPEHFFIALTEAGIQALERMTAFAPDSGARAAANSTEVPAPTTQEVPAAIHDRSSARPPRPKIFISHTSADHRFVKQLAADLERDGCDVWLDDVKMHIGHSIPEQVQKAIGAAHYVVAVLSKASVRRKWVKEELNTALAKRVTKGKRFILPCLIEKCKLPEFLTHRIYADFAAQPYEQAYRKLIASILPAGPVPPRVQAELIRLQDDDPEVREEAAGALGQIGSEAAIPALIEALNDEAWFVRRAAASALGRIGNEAAIPALEEALSDEQWWVRSFAAIALGEIGVEAVIPALENALGDPEEYARESARQALATIRAKRSRDECPGASRRPPPAPRSIR